jgi:hypothetical protein
MITSRPSTEVQTWSIDKLVFYARNPRKNDAAVDRMCGSIREAFSFSSACFNEKTPRHPSGRAAESALDENWEATMKLIT